MHFAIGSVIVLFVVCVEIDSNVTGYGYEMISNRLNSLQGIESDLLTYTNDTVQQLTKMVQLMTRLQTNPGNTNQGPSTPVAVGASCRDVPSSVSGIYRIDPDYPFHEPMTVLCDQQYEGGGWTVIQQRTDGSVNFFRDWKDYKHGFGTLRGEFWLGLEQIHRLTNVAPHELAVLLEDFDGVKAEARYQRFRIAAETLNYAITELGNCNPCGAGDAMRIHLNESFSTYDHDKSKAAFNCAAVFKGGWWFYRCHRCHLNGDYLRGKLTEAQDSQGLMWMEFRGDKYSLKKTKMMIRPIK
ncbi:angiopoietin-related protein 1-like [Anopheles funestus]|uniref:angiopoietin-related protein 1-like n=1 Tax=Anopheles funestus TaxID=62324 RepID=UPI0020C6C1A8|nr:angiopoietin-related protein 1-like [Anopheles funestus]